MEVNSDQRGRNLKFISPSSFKDWEQSALCLVLIFIVIKVGKNLQDQFQQGLSFQVLKISSIKKQIQWKLCG